MLHSLFDAAKEGDSILTESAVVGPWNQIAVRCMTLHERPKPHYRVTKP